MVHPNPANIFNELRPDDSLSNFEVQNLEEGKRFKVEIELKQDLDVPLQELYPTIKKSTHRHLGPCRGYLLLYLGNGENMQEKKLMLWLEYNIENDLTNKFSNFLRSIADYGREGNHIGIS